MKEYYSVGEMAKIHGITSQTLRFYDKIDLFKPEYTNPKTSYRYYTLEQFDKIIMINYLRSLDMTLDSIKEYFQKEDNKSLICFFEKRLEETKKKIKEFQNIEDRLNEEIIIIKNKSKFNKVGIQYFKERLIDFYVLNTCNLQELHQSFNTLANRYKDLESKRFGTIIGEKNLKRNVLQFHSSFIFLQDFTSLETIPCTLSEGDYACIVSSGMEFEQKKSLDILKRYIEENKFDIVGDGILTVLSHMHRKSERILYEIQIPIKKIGEGK